MRQEIKELGLVVSVVVLLVVGGFWGLYWLLGLAPRPPVSTTASTNPAVRVELLFEHDGVKVFRFFDAGNRIYYTDARGKTSWTTNRGNGKTVTVEKHSVETVE